MKDETALWEPIIESLNNLPISGLEVLKTMVEMELAERRTFSYSVALPDDANEYVNRYLKVVK